MKTFKIYGGSDDLLEISGLPGGDEYPFAGTDCDKPDGAQSAVVIGNAEQKLRVLCIYAGRWAFTYWNEEGDEFVAYPARIRPGTKKETDHSMVLEIDVPDDFVVLSVCGTETGQDPEIVAALAVLKKKGITDGEEFESLRDKVR